LTPALNIRMSQFFIVDMLRLYRAALSVALDWNTCNDECVNLLYLVLEFVLICAIFLIPNSRA